MAAISAVAGLLLVLAGYAKLRRPGTTRDTLRRVGLSGSSALARTVGTGEVLLGVALVLVADRVVVAVAAVVFASFAVVAARQRTAGASCGCFGGSDAPVTGLHLVVNVVLALSLAAAAVAGPRPLTAAAGVDLAVGTALALVVATLLRVALVELPTLDRAVAAVRSATDEEVTGGWRTHP